MFIYSHILILQVKGCPKSKQKQKDIALERIKILFKQAAKEPKFAKKYMVLAKKLRTRYKVKIPKALVRKVCKKCSAFLIPSKNCRIRTKNNKIIYTCLECENVMRFPYLREKKKKRSKK